MDGNVPLAVPRVASCHCIGAVLECHAFHVAVRQVMEAYVQLTADWDGVDSSNFIANENAQLISEASRPSEHNKKHLTFDQVCQLWLRMILGPEFQFHKFHN